MIVICEFRIAQIRNLPEHNSRVIKYDCRAFKFHAVWPDWAIMHFGLLFKAFGNNLFAKISHILRQFLLRCQNLSFFWWNHFWATFTGIWRFLSGHTDSMWSGVFIVFGDLKLDSPLRAKVEQLIHLCKTGLACLKLRVVFLPPKTIALSNQLGLLNYLLRKVLPSSYMEHFSSSRWTA